MFFLGVQAALLFAILTANPVTDNPAHSGAAYARSATR